MIWLLLCADGSEVRQLQQELEQSCGEVKRAVAGKEKAEQSLQQIQAQLDENNVSLETLRCELLRLQERNQQGEAEAFSGKVLVLMLRQPIADQDTLTPADFVLGSQTENFVKNLSVGTFLNLNISQSLPPTE